MAGTKADRRIEATPQDDQKKEAIKEVSFPKRDLLYGSIVFFVPFLYLFRYIIPNKSFSRYIVNDFYYIYYPYKVYLLDALSHYRIPLWSPSEACGFPFYSNPFTQTFYPLNIPLAAFYRFVGGYSYFDHQVFTVTGIGFFALGLYLWLRSLDMKSEAALFAVIIASTSLKITEIVRFPNAVHTVAWLPFILWGCTVAFKDRSHYKGAVIIFFSTILMLTGGYLYFVYYSPFLIIPYIFLILIPRTRRAFLSAPERNTNTYTYLVAISAAFSSAFAVCLPYFVKIAHLMPQTVDRGGSDFEYSTAHEFFLTDTLGSLLFPPAASMEGWYYFGIVALLLIVAYIVFVGMSMRVNSDDALFVWIIVIWFLLITYITWGKHSFLFKLLWLYLPGFSSLRVWGRMNIILVPLLALLLSKAYVWFERMMVLPPPSRRPMFRFFIALAGCYSVIMLTQYYFYSHKLFDYYWQQYFLDSARSFDERVFIFYGIFGFIFLMGSLIWSAITERRSRFIFYTCIAVLLVANVSDTGTVATKQWSSAGNPPTERRTLDLEDADVAALATPRKSENGMISLNSQFSVGIVANWYFNRYVDFFKMHEMSSAAAKLLGKLDGGRFYFTKSIDHDTTDDFIQDALAHSASSRMEIHIIKYDGDHLQVKLHVNEGGYFSFIDNWDSDWTAKVNGREVTIEKLFGTFKSIKVQSNDNNIEFNYAPLKWRRNI